MCNDPPKRVYIIYTIWKNWLVNSNEVNIQTNDLIIIYYIARTMSVDRLIRVQQYFEIHAQTIYVISNNRLSRSLQYLVIGLGDTLIDANGEKPVCLFGINI